MTPPDSPKATKEESESTGAEEDLLGDLFPKAPPRDRASSTTAITGRTTRRPRKAVRLPRAERRAKSLRVRARARALAAAESSPNPMLRPEPLRVRWRPGKHKDKTHTISTTYARWGNAYLRGASAAAGARQRQITQPTTRPTIRRPCRREEWRAAGERPACESISASASRDAGRRRRTIAVLALQKARTPSKSHFFPSRSRRLLERPGPEGGRVVRRI